MLKIRFYNPNFKTIKCFSYFIIIWFPILQYGSIVGHYSVAVLTWSHFSVNVSDYWPRPDRFPLSIWNLYERVLNGIHRTINHADTANRRINVEMGMFHHIGWSFITCLRKIHTGRDTYLLQLESGRSPLKSLKIYWHRHKIIKNNSRIR